MKRREFLQGALAVAVLGEGFMMSEKSVLADTVPIGGTLGPLLDPWTGAHNGFPKFDKVKIDEFKPALLKGMDLKRDQIKAITGQAAKPSFDNSIVPFEDSGRPYGRTNRFFDIFTSTMNDKPMQAIESELKPILAKFDDEVIQNDPLFQRIKAVYEVREKSNLNPEQQRLVETYYRQFTRQGAGLDAEKEKAARNK